MAWRASIVNFFPIYAPGGQDNGAALGDYHDRGGFGMEKRILLVEDNAQFTEIFKQAVGQVLAPERLDVTFVEAGSLAEARAASRGRAGRRADRRWAARRGRAGPRARDLRWRPVL
jgi:hypothetical protein